MTETMKEVSELYEKIEEKTRNYEAEIAPIALFPELSSRAKSYGITLDRLVVEEGEVGFEFLAFHRTNETLDFYACHVTVDGRETDYYSCLGDVAPGETDTLSLSLDQISLSGMHTVRFSAEVDRNGSDTVAESGTVTVQIDFDRRKVYAEYKG